MKRGIIMSIMESTKGDVLDYNLKDWIADDEERVLSELNSILVKLGVKIGDIRALRVAVDNLKSNTTQKMK